MNLSACKSAMLLMALSGLAASVHAQSSTPQSGPVIITEIMFNPAGSDEGQEFVEIHNPTTNPVNISGWYLQDEDMTSGPGTNVIPAGTILAPGGTLVIANRWGGTGAIGSTTLREITPALFRQSWPTPASFPLVLVENFSNIGPFDGTTGQTLNNLSNTPSPTNEILTIRDATGTIIDEVNYDDIAPWPTSPANRSIYLIREAFNTTDNDIGSNWRLATAGSDNSITGVAVPPAFGASQGSPGAVPSPSADCNGNSIPDSLDISSGLSQDCNADNIPDECQSTLDCNSNNIPDVCDLRNNPLLDLNQNGILDACDITAGTSQDVNRNGIPDEVDATPSVLISEIMYNPPNNPAIYGGDEIIREWVEIYNFGATPVDISGWKLRDIEGDPATGAFPAGTILLPGRAAVIIPGTTGTNPVPADIADQFRQAWGVSSSTLVIAVDPFQAKGNSATATDEVLSLLTASNLVVDVANYQSPDFNAATLASGWPWNTNHGSLAYVPSGGVISKTSNDDPANWVTSIDRLNGAVRSTQVGVYADEGAFGGAGSPGTLWNAPRTQQTGELIISEILYTANSNFGNNNDRNEFIEVLNVSPACVDISGWFIQDEDGLTRGIPSGTQIAAGEAIVLIPTGAAGVDTATLIAEFRAAWGQSLRVIPLSGWSSTEARPNLLNLANAPTPGNEVLQLRKADATVVDIVNYDDDGSIWPLDSTSTTPGSGLAWSIYVFGPAANFTADANDSGLNWAASSAGLDGAIQNTLTTVFNGNDQGSPGFVQGFTAGAPCTPIGSACGPADLGGEGGSEGFDGNLDNNDFIVFIQYFFAQDARADLGSEGGAAGADGNFDNNDFIVFIQEFFAGGSNSGCNGNP
jgi:hypothetical protein